MTNMKIQSLGKNVYTSLRFCEYEAKRSPVRGSYKQNSAIFPSNVLYNYKKRNSTQQECKSKSKSFINYGQMARESFDDVLDSNMSFMPAFKNQNQQKSAKINCFSDLKRNQKQKPRPNCSSNSLSSEVQHRCLNHPKRRAKFYIESNDHNSTSDSHFYCIQCSLNLTRMNFSINELPHSKGKQHSFQSAVLKLIKFKNNLNKKSQELKNQCSLELVDQAIRETEEKYGHLNQLLMKIKNQEISKLEKIKVKAIQALCEREMKIGNLERKVQYLMDEFGKIGKPEKSWTNIYDQTILKLGKDLQVLIKSTSKCTVQLPKELSMLEITRKLQSLFTETVHELSFEVQSKQQTCSLQSEPQIRLKKYLFNEEKSQTHKNFNSTFGIVEGIDFALSESGSFYDQENIMINI